MGLIIQPGDPDAVSFNDDSSPDTRKTSGLKLSIDAQVLPGESLDWFYRLLQLCESVPNELKSDVVWEQFKSASTEVRTLVWAGLSKVRIHIVDPRPYRKTHHEIIRTIYRCDDADAFIRQQIQADQPIGRLLSEMMQVTMAENILNDSMAARVHSLSRYVNEEIGLITEGGSQLEVANLSDFGLDLKPLVRKVSIWSAKSAAAFNETYDAFWDWEEYQGAFPNEIIRRRMEGRVLKSHAFDKGNSQVGLLETARTNILSNLKKPYDISKTFGRKPYTELDSVDSYGIQAADLGSGIASKILEQENLVSVAKRFEYVTYNGRRISVSDAEEETRLLNR